MEQPHVYGPVQSRRFGRSLGVSLFPGKTCNCDCVYCGFGATPERSHHRHGVLAPDEILQELRVALEAHASEVDYVTFCGEGEPTLCQSLGYLIVQTRKLSAAPIAVLTNGTLLGRDDVQRSLQRTDVVVASLCAADERTFKRLHRQEPKVSVDTVIDGIVAFKAEHSGQLWLEVMLVAGINDGEPELRALRAALDRISPERVYLATPCDPPTVPEVRPPDAESLTRARSIFPEATVLEGDAGGLHRPACRTQPAPADRVS